MSGRRSATGAVTAQFSQAAASFLLSVAGLRTLSTADFGVLALLLGVMVVATALMTGFVGDSLTILNRQDDRVRAALELWGAFIAVLLVVFGIIFGKVTGLLSLTDAGLFGLALAAFTIEDCARRLLMASLRFWSVVVTDLSYFGVLVAVLLVARTTQGHLVLADFLVALVIGQALATVVGVVLLPGAERRIVGWAQPALRTVAAFGAWRALQQSLRPGLLTLVRLLVVLVAGRTALGHLEAARVYMSPGLLLAQGAGGFLLASYAADRHLHRRAAVKGADRTALTLVGISAALSLVLVLCLPALGDLVSGDETSIAVLATVAWGFYAAGAATGMPYTSLASVRSPQRTVVGLRVVDVIISLSLAAVVLGLFHATPSVVPFAMGVGIFIGAGLQRWVALSDGRVISEQTATVASR